MKTGRPRLALIGAIIRKDLREFRRDRVWMILTPLSLVLLVGACWLLPDQVHESLSLGITPPEMARGLDGALSRWSGAKAGDRTGAPELSIVPFATEDELAAAVAGGGGAGAGQRIALGVAFPRDFLTGAMAGAPATISIYAGPALPLSARAVTSAVRELALGLRALSRGGSPLAALPVTLPPDALTVVGQDGADLPVSLRERLRPLLAILIVLMESLALAGLVALEIEHRTAAALLVTPLSTGDLLAAKAATGTLLAMGQGFLFLVLTRSLGLHWHLVIALLLLGSVMASAIGMIAGAAGRDFLGTLFLSFVLMAPLMIPAFAVIMPGSAPLIVELLPSYGIIVSLASALSRDGGWHAALPDVWSALAWNAVLLGSALLILKRRVEGL